MFKGKFKIQKSDKIILSLLIIYAVVVLAIFLPFYIRLRREKVYIVTNNLRIKYEYGKWSEMKFPDDFANKLFKTYNEGNYLGEYTLGYQDRLYIYGDDRRVNYNGTVFASSGTLDTSFTNVSNLDISDTDRNIVNQALSKYNIGPLQEFSTLKRILVDIDKDGSDERIYCVSNFYSNDDGKKISLIFIYDDDKIDVIDDVSVRINDVYSAPSFSLIGVLDIGNDNKYELLYTKKYFSEPDSECAVLYNLSKRKVINNFCEN